MLYVGIAVSNKEMAKSFEEHLTNDKTLKVLNLSDNVETILHKYSLTLFDLIIIDDSISLGSIKLYDLMTGLGLNNHHTKFIKVSRNTSLNSLLNEIDFARGILTPKKAEINVDDIKHHLHLLRLF